MTTGLTEWFKKPAEMFSRTVPSNIHAANREMVCFRPRPALQDNPNVAETARKAINTLEKKP